MIPLAAAGAAGDIASKIIGSLADAKAKKNESIMAAWQLKQQSNQPAPKPEKKDNTKLYLIIGIVAVILISAIAYFVLKTKKS